MARTSTVRSREASGICHSTSLTGTSSGGTPVLVSGLLHPLIKLCYLHFCIGAKSSANNKKQQLKIISIMSDFNGTKDLIWAKAKVATGSRPKLIKAVWRSSAWAVHRFSGLGPDLQWGHTFKTTCCDSICTASAAANRKMKLEIVILRVPSFCWAHMRIFMSTSVKLLLWWLI